MIDFVVKYQKSGNMGSIENLNGYMKREFHDIPLCMPLFYNAQIGIRFEIGCSDLDFSDKKYIEFVNVRSMMIFDDLFSGDSNIFLVVNEHVDLEDSERKVNGIELYHRYLFDKNKCKEVTTEEIPYYYRDEAEDTTLKTFRYSLLCKVRDINYRPLLKVIGKQMGFSPFEYYEVYFINMETDVIYHLYSDEGLDVVSNEKDALIRLYKKYNDWILDYDRQRIIQIFE